MSGFGINVKAVSTGSRLLGSLQQTGAFAQTRNLFQTESLVSRMMDVIILSRERFRQRSDQYQGQVHFPIDDQTRAQLNYLGQVHLSIDDRTLNPAPAGFVVCVLRKTGKTGVRVEWHLLNAKYLILI